MSLVVDAEKRPLRSVNAEVKTALTQGPVTVQGAAESHGLASGLKRGDVTIEGDSGDYLGALNDGATIRVTGDAGRFLADNMTRGLVIVDGDAGYGAGTYCYGGTILIRGDAGDFTAVMNKGATILIQGSVGDDVATYMLAGDLVIVGDSGKNLGNYLIRGDIYIGGAWESLGNNTQLAGIDEADRTKLCAYFEEFGLQADPAHFKKIVRLSERPFYKAKELVRDESPQAAALPVGQPQER